MLRSLCLFLGQSISLVVTIWPKWTGRLVAINTAALWIQMNSKPRLLTANSVYPIPGSLSYCLSVTSTISRIDRLYIHFIMPHSRPIMVAFISRDVFSLFLTRTRELTPRHEVDIPIAWGMLGHRTDVATFHQSVRLTFIDESQSSISLSLSFCHPPIKPRAGWLHFRQSGPVCSVTCESACRQSGWRLVSICRASHWRHRFYTPTRTRRAGERSCPPGSPWRHWPGVFSCDRPHIGGGVKWQADRLRSPRRRIMLGGAIGSMLSRSLAAAFFSCFPASSASSRVRARVQPKSSPPAFALAAV